MAILFWIFYLAAKANCSFILRIDFRFDSAMLMKSLHSSLKDFFQRNKSAVFEFKLPGSKLVFSFF